MTIEELSSVLQMQEEILQFSSFTNADAWELGNLIVAEAAKRGAAVLVRIRLNNGYTVFPIRVEEVGVIGTVAITGLDHVSEHDLLVKCISKYLHVAEVPRIRAM